MNIFPDSYEGWNMFFQIASVILVLLTFAAAAGTVITGRVINNRQARQILELKTDLEKERQTRLQMETTFMPRNLDAQEVPKRLKDFSGMQVVIECLDEHEAIDTAGQLLNVLVKSGWKPIDFNWHFRDALGFFPGIHVQTNAGTPPEGDRSLLAAQAFFNELQAARIDSINRQDVEGVLPPNTIKGLCTKIA